MQFITGRTTNWHNVAVGVGYNGGIATTVAWKPARYAALQVGLLNMNDGNHFFIKKKTQTEVQ